MAASESRSLVPGQYLEFLQSERVSPKTREVLEARMQPLSGAPEVLNAVQVTTLRAMLARVIPQEEPALDLPAYVLERLGNGRGDGWRYDVLPEDCQAYREGLDRLAASGFNGADAAGQDAFLEQLARGSAADQRWFEEVRGDATAAYVSHPATMARLGYSGIGVGGAGTRYQGFVSLRPNEPEDWEPAPIPHQAR